MSAIAAINIAKKEIGLDEDTYRTMLQRVTGKVSLKLMTSTEHYLVLDALGGTVNRKLKGQLEGRYGVKLQALWLSGWNLGVVKDNTDAALLSFIKGQTGVDHTRFLVDAKDARKAVEALKKWLARDAKVEWSAMADPKDCVIQAQLSNLADDAGVADLVPVRSWRAGTADDKAKIALMKRLGTRIRARPAKVGAQ